MLYETTPVCICDKPAGIKYKTNRREAQDPISAELLTLSQLMFLAKVCQLKMSS